MAGRSGTPIILLAGPTASGKSELALRTAERLGGAVVNADSMQIYRDLQVITSRPTQADMMRAPHLLYGHVDAGEPRSVGDFLREAGEVLKTHRDVPLIFTGGTGLHLQALMSGLSETPPVPDEVRGFWRLRGLSASPAELHAELRARDPLMAERIRSTDPQRILRALEVFDATGVSLLQWQTRAGKPLIEFDRAFPLVLQVERSELRARIAGRFQSMMEQDALEEVRGLLTRRLDPALPAMKAIGVPPLAAYLRSESSLQAAVAQAITDSRQYAKRQDTWFRNRFPYWPRLSATSAESVLQKL